MKKHSICSKLISMLLVFSMVLAWVPMTAAAADVNTLEAGDTGLQDGTGVDVSDVISLPIEIYDYNADGMLFEYGSSSPFTFSTDGSTIDTDLWLRAENASLPSGGIVMDFTTNYASSYAAAFYSSYLGSTSGYSATATSGTADYGNTDTLNYLSWAITDNTNGYLVNFSDQSYEAGIYGWSGFQLSQIRYMTLVYRSTGGTADQTVNFHMWNSNVNGFSHVYSVPLNNLGTTWRYMVVDLNGAANDDGTYASLTDTIGAVNAQLPSGIGLAFAGYFPTEEAANQFGEDALLYTGQTFHTAGENTGFGMLWTSYTNSYGDYTNYTTYDEYSVAQYINLNYGTNGDAGVVMPSSNTTTPVDTSSLDLGYDFNLHGTITGLATMGLLQPELSEDGYPVYKEATVSYIANLLQQALSIPEVDATTGYKNYDFVQGVADSRYGADPTTGKTRDFAEWLRDRTAATYAQTGDSLGSYAAASQKNLVGEWDDVKDNIATYYDAAYFMLNSLFKKNSYNMPQDDYHYLLLSGATDDTGEKIYVFDAGFTQQAYTSDMTAADVQSDIKYDDVNHYIQNTSGLGKTQFYYQTSDTTTLYPFLPIRDGDGNNTNGVTKTPYFLDPGVLPADGDLETYKDRNYNYVIASRGLFTYYAEENLFFNFEGDDDVYLFIDGKLVLDIGGAHPITTYELNLNDCAETLGLEDGVNYRFDFFYMERHGAGANMRIETNIRVTDPAMTTEKTAYQNGLEVEYGGIINGDEIVEYGFSIENTGEERLYNLSFYDHDIGVSLTPADGLVVTGDRVYDVNGGDLDVTDLSALITHPDYEDIHVTFDTPDELKNFLATFTTTGNQTVANLGLFTEAKVLIRGIGYRLSEEQKKAAMFENTVYSSASNSSETKWLQGQAHTRVYLPSGIDYFQWAEHELQISLDKLVMDITNSVTDEENALKHLTAAAVTGITEVNRVGYATDYSEITVGSDKGITVNYVDPGTHNFYLKVSYGEDSTAIIPVVVHVTYVEDSVFVLDYGLSVDLTKDGELFKNDILVTPGHETSYSIIALGSNGAYSPNEITFTADADNAVTGTNGTFTLSGSDLTYKPSNFMEAIDTVQVAVNVYDSGYTPTNIDGDLNINMEVEMYKSISIIPATVIYYEDDFPAIQYVKDGTTNTFEQIGSSDDQNQSNDQDQEYGQDDAYQNNSDMSAGVLTTVTINQSGQVAYFTFNGTGFELISRTNAKDSAIITIKIYNSADAPNGVPVEGATVLKSIPVITEYDNGANDGDEAIYQVPVIRVDDLGWGSYTVLISGVPTRDFSNLDENGVPAIIPTKLYVDGLRIYQPIGSSNDNYLETENGAAFVEVRDEIVKGYIAAAEYNGATLTASTSTTTWTEKYEDENYTNDPYYQGNKVSSVKDYLLQGPNNEVYMAGDSTTAALVFYVEETGTGVHNLQIAVHAVDVGLFHGTNSTGMNAVIQYGVKSGETFAWMPLVTVTSGTEQYYTIDYTNAPYVDGKGYQIAVKVESGMASFTSLKLNGLNLVSIGGESTTFRYVDGILTDTNTGTAAATQNYMEFQTLSLQMKSDLIVTDETPDDAPVDEPTETPDDTPVEEGFAKPTRQDKIRKLLQMMEMLRRRR